MVKDTGKTLRADTYRPVNAPQPVEVEEDANGLPLALKMTTAVKPPSRPAVKPTSRHAVKPQRQVIVSFDLEMWRIDDEWWRREPVSRIYYSVRLVSGHRLVLYKDLINYCWYRQSY